MVLLGSIIDDSEDEFDIDLVEGMDELKKWKVGNVSIVYKRVEILEEFSDESGDLFIVGVKKFIFLIMRIFVLMGNFLRICLLYVCLIVLYFYFV